MTFTIVISCEKGETIYYTLDGREPNNESIRYRGPMRISDASKNKNVYCNNTDVSVGFDEKTILQMMMLPPGYRTPDYLIDKCTIIRAVCYNSEGTYSKVVNKSYFVGYNEKQDYDRIGVISIITDPENLFGYENGIYVTGVRYDEYQAYHEPSWTDDYWWWWRANYRHKGRDSEREAYIEIYDQDKTLILDKKIGIRIQEGGSRGYNPKSLNLYARKQYDGDPYFPDCFFEGYNPRKITLFAGGDSRITKLDDYLMSNIVSECCFATMKYIPVVLFLDGEYWGCYWLTEKYDDEFIAYHYNLESDNIVMIKNGELEEGEDGDINLYLDMVTYITTNDMNDESNYVAATKIIDIESIAEYYAAEIYIGRYGDWPTGNIAMWRTRSSDGEDYEDVKWRWMLFDVNSGAFDISHTYEDTVYRIMNTDSLFSSLMKNESFQDVFYKKLKKCLTLFEPQRVKEMVIDFRSIMEDPLKTEHKRFYVSNYAIIEKQYYSQITNIETFIFQRYNYISRYIETLEKIKGIINYVYLRLI